MLSQHHDGTLMGTSCGEQTAEDRGSLCPQEGCLPLGLWPASGNLGRTYTKTGTAVLLLEARKKTQSSIFVNSLSLGDNFNSNVNSHTCLCVLLPLFKMCVIKMVFTKNLV